MANIDRVIEQLKVIVSAPYQGKASSRDTFHRQAFDRLQGSAEQVAAILEQNKKPNSDTSENIQAQFDAMQKLVSSYCTNTAGTESVLRAFHHASTEWDLYRREM